MELRFVDFLEFIGTFAFAISGIRLASAKHFDWFGAYVVGFATAVGGGTIRDLLLGVTPFWMHSSSYLIFTAIAFFFVVLFRKALVRLDDTFFYFDTIGLGLFVVVGCNKTLQMDAHYAYWVVVIMGMLTGAAGGVLRDILINEVPLIFRKEIYALACLFGGTVFCICDAMGVATVLAQIISAVSVVIIRLLAVKYHLCLPVLKRE
ncbi:MAG: trimeric intracellular cation channel family protein [Bacteroidales bacterium]|nr:trimeric intracellular cation channel family protein [Bacteroidales bacterium]MDD4820972.1 trimeric intracellular cation channel family protein [Bacteroidales bacterium]